LITVVEGKQWQYPLQEIDSWYDPNRPLKGVGELSFELLVRVGLVSRIHIEELWGRDTQAIELVAYAATDVGIEFFKSVADPAVLARAVNTRKKNPKGKIANSAF
jgi:hypothetical protein